MDDHGSVEPDERDHGNKDQPVQARIVHPEEEWLLLRPLVADEKNGLLDDPEEEEVGADLHEPVEERTGRERDHERVPLMEPEAEAHGRCDDVEAEEAGDDDPEERAVILFQDDRTVGQESGAAGCGHMVSGNHLFAG
jgi:hypothetical protein